MIPWNKRARRLENWLRTQPVAARQHFDALSDGVLFVVLYATELWPDEYFPHPDPEPSPS